ncbi:hypothetical protein Cni_G29186 [Canna indica]|uniref:Uncharacterized protein n=1 Tax=Canna indica TaxID=4628 RepID=A0AAQ3L8N3_9LILI|nr:hypothetical protein Cni_G29186 [Canna indica]
MITVHTRSASIRARSRLRLPDRLPRLHLLLDHVNRVLWFLRSASLPGFSVQHFFLPHSRLLVSSLVSAINTGLHPNLVSADLWFPPSPPNLPLLIASEDEFKNQSQDSQIDKVISIGYESRGLYQLVMPSSAA